MSFFKKLFGGNSQPVEDKEFTAFFNDTVNRYFSDPAGTTKVEFSTPDNTVVAPQFVFAAAYQQCKEIQSVWDKRSVLYKALDEKCIQSLSHWQLAERFITDRLHESAQVYLAEQCTTDDFKDAELLTTAARCYFYLSDFDKALDYANTALQVAPHNKRAQLIQADILHLTGHHTRAHEIYNSVLAASKLKDASGTITAKQVVGFADDILHSSVYAAAILTGSDDEEAWNEVATEFYHCPYFRSQHGFWLINRRDNVKGIVKLIVTTQEFPWYKDAVVNARNGILQLQQHMKNNEVFSNELQYLNSLMAQNNW